MSAYPWPKVGDTGPALTWQLRHDPVDWKTEGAVVDLTGAARIVAVFRHAELCRVLGAWQIGLSGVSTAGTVTMPLQAELTAHPGLVERETVVTWNDGTEQTFPSRAGKQFDHLVVKREIPMPDTVPVIGTTPPGSSVIEVTPATTLPAAYVTELVNLTAVDGANQPGLYRWSGTAYVPVDSATTPTQVDDQVTAATAISAFQVVEQTAAGIQPYNPTIANPLDVFGVAVTAGAAGATVDVITDGIASGATGLTAGSTYYAAAGGSLTTVQPTTGLLVVIGYASSAAELVVQVGEPVEL